MSPTCQGVVALQAIERYKQPVEEVERYDEILTLAKHKNSMTTTCEVNITIK